MPTLQEPEGNLGAWNTARRKGGHRQRWVIGVRSEKGFAGRSEFRLPSEAFVATPTLP